MELRYTLLDGGENDPLTYSCGLCLDKVTDPDKHAVQVHGRSYYTVNLSAVFRSARYQSSEPTKPLKGESC